MEQLYEIFDIKLRSTSLKFSRFLYHTVNWDNRLISILGARGSGKTTLVLQYIKHKFRTPSKEVLYADVNHIYFSRNTLLELADRFYKAGGKYLFFDEIHKYRGWSNEIKQIHDTYKGLFVVFTGSSILEIKKGEADLSRRVVSYLLPGLSFREFLELDQSLKFDVVSWDDLLRNSTQIAHDISSRFKPLAYFGDYLRYGYYPFFAEGKKSYPEKLMNTIELILEVDLPSVESIDFAQIQKLKKLLAIISESSPFKPNTQKLAALTGVSRVTLIKFFSMLDRAQLLLSLNSAAKGIRRMGKPEKIYLNNTNLMYTLAPETVNRGNLRETFFFNQVQPRHKVALPKTGDFFVDNQYLFEVGGGNKTHKQIAGIADAFIVKDDIETGATGTIPLWLFGFLY